MDFSALPQWATIAIAAGIAAFIGTMIGSRFGRGRERADGSSAGASVTVVETPTGNENQAFQRFQELLREKGIGAKEQDTRLREFAAEYAALRRKLQDLRPSDSSRAEMARRALDCLEAGELAESINLASELGRAESEEGLTLRDRAQQLLTVGAAAKVIAADLKMVLMEPADASELYRQASEELPPSAEDKRAEILNKYGTACYQAGDHDEAVKAFTRGLRMLEKTLGLEHPDIATSLNNLALIHYSKGRLDQAEPLYRRALMIDEKVFGYDHPSVATDLNNLALLYKKQGNLAAAEPLLKRALKEKTFDPGHPSLVTGLKNYAALLRSLNRGDEAKAYESRAASLPPSLTDTAG
ncbi:MAG: tetratricopeptide repeat protein [Proteobacteria bacterium]|nr:tetratricopeptide repeat protein [Pseudomonadota bacterium]